MGRTLLPRALAIVVCICLAVPPASAGCMQSSPGVTAALAPVLEKGRGSSKRDTAVWTDVRSVYGSRQGRPLWVTDRQVSSAADEALAAIGRASEHGLDPERYGAAALAREIERLRDGDAEVRTPAALAKLDADLTHALLAMGHDVAIGVSDSPPPGATDRDRDQTPPDFAARLLAIVDDGRLEAWPDDVRPGHAQYAALQAALKAKTAGGAALAETDRQRIGLNLERWRHMPDDLGARHIIVNIPRFQLSVHEGDRLVLEQRIIVGTQGDKTPVFSADMNQVVFSPYWNIPESIASGETIPAILRDPKYLARNNIEVLRRSGGTVERVDPSTVDWNDPSVTKELSLRQRPGAANALGHVKFLMPNRHAVYLHDTPADQLFEEVGRAFSHGCVRLEKPVALAKYVLADQPEWTDEKIQAAMDSGREQAVKVLRPIPVHIVYFTAWVDEAGQVQVFKDVYGRDRLK